MNGWEFPELGVVVFPQVDEPEAWLKEPLRNLKDIIRNQADIIRNQVPASSDHDPHAGRLGRLATSSRPPQKVWTTQKAPAAVSDPRSVRELLTKSTPIEADELL